MSEASSGSALLYNEYGSDDEEEDAAEEELAINASASTTAMVASVQKRVDISGQVLAALLEAYHIAKTKSLKKCLRALVATLLELSPAELIRGFAVSHLTVILDLAHSQLMDVDPQFDDSASLDGFRILQALLRKSAMGSSFFKNVRRRGIYDLVLQIAQDMKPTLTSIAVLFIRHFDLKCVAEPKESQFPELTSIRADLKNNASSDIRITALTRLASLISDPDGLTAHEFNVAGLAHTVLEFLGLIASEKGDASACVQEFKRVFVPPSKSPEDEEPKAILRLIQLLLAILATTEKLEISTFPTPRGKPFHGLTRPVKIELWDATADVSTPLTSVNVGTGMGGGCVIMAQPLVKFGQLEKAVLRNIFTTDEKYIAYCHSLAGKSIQRKVGSRYEPFLVLGYDEARGIHLLRAAASNSKNTNSAIELRLHEETYKFSGSIQVRSVTCIDLSSYGTVVAENKAEEPSSTSTRRSKRRRSKVVDSPPKSKKSKTTAAVEVGTLVELFPGRLRGIAGALSNRTGTIRRVNSDDTLNVKVEGDPKTYRITSGQCRNIPAVYSNNSSGVRIGQRVWVRSLSDEKSPAQPAVVLDATESYVQVSIKNEKVEVLSEHFICVSKSNAIANVVPRAVGEEREIESEKNVTIAFQCDAPPRVHVKLGLHDRFMQNSRGEAFSIKSALTVVQSSSKQKSIVLSSKGRQAFSTIFNKFAIDTPGTRRRASLRKRATDEGSSSATANPSTVK